MPKKKKEVVSSEVPENIDTTQAELEHLDLSEEPNQDEGFVEKPKSKDVLLEEVKKEEESVNDVWKRNIPAEGNLSEKYYGSLSKSIEMVSSGNYNKSLIVHGGAGISKTFTTCSELKRLGMDSSYAYTNTFTTPLSLYIWLYKNRNNGKVIDDVHKILEAEGFSPFLKSLLGDIAGTRIVEYQSTKPVQDERGKFIPSRFIENGWSIFLTNKFNEKNDHLQAVKSRVMYLKLDFNYEQMFEIMAEMAKREYKDTTLAERMGVLSYLKSITTPSTKDVNLRTLVKAYDTYRFDRDNKWTKNWKLMVEEMLEEDELCEEVMDIEKDTELNTVKLKVAEFKSRTGKSRATYFRLKKQIFGDEKKKEVSKSQTNGKNHHETETGKKQPAEA